MSTIINESAAPDQAADSLTDLQDKSNKNGPFSEETFERDVYLPEALERLRNLKIWVGFELNLKEDGRWDKIPISPVKECKASSSDPTTWGTFQEVCGLLSWDKSSKYKCRHIAFVFMKILT